VVDTTFGATWENWKKQPIKILVKILIKKIILTMLYEGIVKLYQNNIEINN